MPRTAAERIAASTPHDGNARARQRTDSVRVASSRRAVCFLYDRCLNGVYSSSEGYFMADTSTRHARWWADLIAMFASVAAFDNAISGPLIFSTLSYQVTSDAGAGYDWFAFGGGGILGVLGVIVAQKRPGPGRIAIAVGGALLVIVPFFYEHRSMLPIVTSVVLGIAMLVSAFFLGPMPATRRVAEQQQARR
jgi:hypothetical protein